MEQPADDTLSVARLVFYFDSSMIVMFSYKEQLFCNQKSEHRTRREWHKYTHKNRLKRCMCVCLTQEGLETICFWFKIRFLFIFPFQPCSSPLLGGRGGARKRKDYFTRCANRSRPKPTLANRRRYGNNNRQEESGGPMAANSPKITIKPSRNLCHRLGFPSSFFCISLP